MRLATANLRGLLQCSKYLLCDISVLDHFVTAPLKFKALVRGQVRVVELPFQSLTGDLAMF